MPCGRSVPPPITAPRGDGAVSEDDGAVRKQESAPEISTAVGAAVVLLALAGICALLASHLLIGALRLAAGVLAGAGLGMLVLPIARRWLPRQRRRLLAAALALLVAAALTVPAAVDSRTPPHDDPAVAVLEPLDEHAPLISVSSSSDTYASPGLSQPRRRHQQH